MKKNTGAYFLLFSIIFIIMFISCGSLIDAVLPPVKESTQQLHWKLGEFINEWEEPLGKYFIRYEGTVKATFFIESNRRGDGDIKDITFSEADGFTFLIPTTTGSAPVSSREVDVIIRTSAVNEKTFVGFYNGPNRGKIRVEYSNELRDILLLDNVIIRLTMSNAFYRYQFNLPERFPEGYEVLLNKEKGK